jgi:hypothetical protein
MVREFKQTSLVVREDLKQGDCHSPKQAWDEQRGACFDMFLFNGREHEDSKRYFGGSKDMDLIFPKFGMDPGVTMRNAAECWELGKGDIDNLPPSTSIWVDGSKLPRRAQGRVHEPQQGDGPEPGVHRPGRRRTLAREVQGRQPQPEVLQHRLRIDRLLGSVSY